MKEKGQTLIEVIIAVALFAMVIVGFMQALNVGIWGTYRTSQSNLALNLARSQVEYIKLQDYQPCTDANCSVTYAKLNKSVVEDQYPGFSIDDIEIVVANVSGSDAGALQQVTVTVTYETGARYAEVVEYKAPRVGYSATGPGGDLGVASAIIIPPPPWLYGKEGYYYVFETGLDGPLCATWVYTSEKGGAGDLLRLYVMCGTPFGDGEGLLVLESAQPFCNAAENECGTCKQEQAAWQPETETFLVAMEVGELPAGNYTALFYNSATPGERVRTSTGSITYWW